jgi:opacity protein-like surface antigen
LPDFDWKEICVFKTTSRWLFVALLFVPSAAAAQEPGDIGVFMGYPSLGLVWQVSEKVAIRPEIAFSSTSTEVESSFSTGTSQGWNLRFGGSALFYLKDADRLRTYVAPQFTYSRTHTETSSSQSEAAGNSYGFAGLFGAQYSLNDRFSVFGELGLAYTHSTLSDLISTDSQADNWGTRTGVGVILYF